MRTWCRRCSLSWFDEQIALRQPESPVLFLREPEARPLLNKRGIVQNRTFHPHLNPLPSRERRGSGAPPIHPSGFPPARELRL